MTASGLSCIIQGLFLSCGIWDPGPWSGMEPRPSALGAKSLSHWTTREVPTTFYLIINDVNIAWEASCPWLKWYPLPEAATWDSVHNTGLHRLGPEVPENLTFSAGSHLICDSLLTCTTEIMPSYPSPDAKLHGENIVGEKTLFFCFSFILKTKSGIFFYFQALRKVFAYHAV